MDKTRAFVSFAGLSLIILGIGCSSSDSAAGETAPKPTEVAAKPVPSIQQALDVFSQRCMPCHSTGKPPEGLTLDNGAGVLKGSEHGPVVVAGDAAGSLIIQRMRASNGRKIMPPKGQPATEAEIKAVEEWINAGASSS